MEFAAPWKEGFNSSGRAYTNHHWNSYFHRCAIETGNPRNSAISRQPWSSHCTTASAARRSAEVGEASPAPSRARELYVGVQPGHVLDLRRQVLDQQVERIALVPELEARAQLQVPWVGRVGDLEVPVAERNLDRVKHHAGHLAHMGCCGLCSGTRGEQSSAAGPGSRPHPS
jgi:hypothetical protein